ncbi:MAG: thiamine phosphate synthase [Microbacteriaceae bacterium]|nr:thiamine phosphate synthase [Microbacteriaceae bacterium]
MTVDHAQLYLCTDARTTQGDFSDFLDAAFAGGVDIIQLRDKHIHAGHELELLAVLAEAAARNGKLWAVNDRADLAAVSGAPVFHVGQDDLPVNAARTLLTSATVIGLSSHTPTEVDAALVLPALDYFCVGPIWATPTKPGRAAVGLELVRYAAEQVRTVRAGAVQAAALQNTHPWFAIGGIDESNIVEVVAAGAERVVVVRAITQSADPTAAAQRLRGYLPTLR